jgi:hypothetical protein
MLKVFHIWPIGIAERLWEHIRFSVELKDLAESEKGRRSVSTEFVLFRPEARHSGGAPGHFWELSLAA